MKEIDKELFNKIKQGKTVSELEACIFRGAGIYATNDEGESIIHIAAKYGRQDFIVKLVQGYHVDVNHLDSEGRTPIYHAALCNRSGTVKTLVNKLRADFNIADRSGIAPIHAAILSEGITNKNLQDQSKINKLSLDILKFLVEVKEVDVNCITKNRWAPLHCAAKRGCFKIVEFLMNKGAIVGAKNSDGRNPLHIAATNGHVDIVDYLLNKEVDTNDTDKENHTALYYAAWNGHRGVMDLLMNKGAKNIDINGEDRMLLKGEDCMLLYRALDKDYLEVVKFIVEVNKVKVNSIDEEGRTLLFYLVDKGNPKVAELVINKGENVNPLSSLDCEVEIAKYLLSKGANIFVKDNYNRTLYVVAKKIYDEHSKSMLDCSATKSPPCDSQDITDKVFDLEADLGALTISGANETNRDSQTLSRFSTEESSLAVGGAFFNSRTSLKSDGRVNNTSTSAGSSTPASTSGFTSDSNISEGDKITNSSSKPSSALGGARQKELVQPLPTSMPDNSETQDITYVSLGNAVKSGTVKEVISLIDKCQDINKTYEKGNTLLHFAIERVHLSIFRVLVKNGANHSSCNEEGNTPLHFVGRSNKLKLVRQLNGMARELIREGADPNSCNKEGDTPLGLAVKGGLLPVVKTLLENGTTVDNEARKKLLDSVKTGPNDKEIKDLLCTFSERERERRSIQEPRSSLQPSTHEASRSRGASDFGKQRTFSEREKERRSIQEPRDSLQPPTYAAPRSRSAESDPKPEDEGKWVMRAGQGKKVNPRGRGK